MPYAIPAHAQPLCEKDLVKQGIKLLVQQTWCWGQDILRPEGNWLLEIGFDREEAPSDRERCSSVYALELPQGRRIVLRGFGVFYGDDRLGGVFLPRYEFLPKYTPAPKLDCPPWSSEDLPALKIPNAEQLGQSTSLTMDLISWISGYEASVAEHLGVKYRRATLDSWKANKKPVIPAEDMASSWRLLGIALGGNFQAVASQN